MDPITIAMGLAQFAPGIIKWITGSEKAESAATKIVDIAKAATGQSTGEAALITLKADPNAVIAFRQSVMANEADLDKAFLLDRQNARGRDVAIVQAGRYNWRADVLAVLAVGGLVLCVYFIARDAGLPERAVNAIMFVAGVLASAVRDVYGFEFGSSRSSQVKDGTISELAKHN
jgi:hypothetical protein